MKAVVGFEPGQDIAVCRQRSLPLSFLEPQPAVTQKASELLAFRGLRAGCDQCGVRLLGNIEVIAVKPPRRHTGPQSKGVQLVIGGVTDHMRPQTAVRRPAWWGDPDRHPLLPSPGPAPNRPPPPLRSEWAATH